jgi:fibronectin type 3 domain-containing protein
MKNRNSILVSVLMMSMMALSGCGGGGTDYPIIIPTVTTVPAAPVATAVRGNTQVTVSWAAVSTATSYNVYWSTTTGVTPASGTKVTGATSPFVQPGLTNGTTYFYVVTALNAKGESTPSAQVSATPAVPPVPVAPVATAVGGSGQITVSWSAVTDATSYNVYWSATTGVTPATGTKITGATSPFVQAGLATPTTRFYVVTAVNSTGESVASAQVTATTTSAPPPAVPTGVTAAFAATTVTNTNQANLAWTAVSGATSYNIYWSTTTGVTPATGTKITVATTSGKHNPPINALTYFYVVTAVNANGEGAASTQVSVAMLDGAALYVTNGTSGTNCSSCHNALVSSAKRGRTAAQIQTAIGTNRGGMGEFSAFTAAQVQAIANALF